ncbi:MAG: bifunctional protein-serine/threonine kinase/phosphatase [Hahellaceae bacterium]|nr:bifunctional protein-serine/threonine kinase/phosphatase [Hahellaceae bacterium]MCP5210363.1 bifunctional protein-serine/threonine kinase/phosphatase [Hahellaceae bacterium]
MKKQLAVSVGQYSSPGIKPINQDFHGVLIPNEPHLSSKGIAIAIADGISSSNVSQIASETAVKGFIQDYYSTSDSWSVKTSAQRVLKATNSWLYAQTRNSPYRFNKDKGYICTFSAIVFKSNTAHLFHCGDSRIFRLVDNTLEQLTTDHRHVVDEQTSYLTRALGIHDTLEMDYKTLPLNLGDVYVLATDGVFEFIPAKEIAEAISQGSDLNHVAKELVDKAFAAGSNDNLTIQIVRLDNLPEQYVAEVQQQLTQLPAAPQLSARMQFDGYHILRDIYISSRSHVFLAEDTDTGEKVVIKTPSMEMRNHPETLENFLMEDWIAKRLNNAHVLRAIEPTRKRHYLYTVTEYIEGQTLAQWMIDNPSPDIETVRNIIEQIGKGLQAFHRQEMVHQDLRPNNIMIDAAGTVKIIDFGATKVAGISEVVPKNEGIVGTAQFTAPEYFLGELGTPQSDLFSLGVIAYKMLSGSLPYGNSVSRITNRREQGRLTYQPLRNEDNTIPGWVDYAISKATHIDPFKRYAEVSEFVYELKTPSPNYLSKTKPPLMARNPVLFWQCVSLVLLGIIIFQAAR